MERRGNFFLPFLGDEGGKEGVSVYIAKDILQDWRSRRPTVLRL
jgi:hypothetical protein